LSTLQFCEGFSGFATHVPTVICIFLPLSSVWAGVSNDAKIAAKGPDSHQRLIHGEFYRSGASSTISDGTTVCDKSRQMSMCTYTKSKDVESGADILSLPTSSNNTIGSAGIRVDHDFILSRENARDQV
jgi:pheromone alpha factor receptor